MYIYLKIDELLPVAPSFGFQYKADIQDIASLIKTDGLLNLLRVQHTNTGYKIIDGMKRYCAIAHLTQIGTLPRSLNRIPCVIVDIKAANDAQPLPLLITNGELYDRVLEGHEAGQAAASLATRYDCTEETVDRMLSLQNLHPEVLACFRRDHLSFAQAAAFATLPNPQAQWDLLKRLGPFVREQDIMDAIESGETVISLPNGDCVILPSRMPGIVAAKQVAATYKLAV